MIIYFLIYQFGHEVWNSCVSWCNFHPNTKLRCLHKCIPLFGELPNKNSNCHWQFALKTIFLSKRFQYPDPWHNKEFLIFQRVVLDITNFLELSVFGNLSSFWKLSGCLPKFWLKDHKHSHKMFFNMVNNNCDDDSKSWKNYFEASRFYWKINFIYWSVSHSDKYQARCLGSIDSR